MCFSPWLKTAYIPTKIFVLILINLPIDISFLTLIVPQLLSIWLLHVFNCNSSLIGKYLPYPETNCKHQYTSLPIITFGYLHFSWWCLSSTNNFPFPYTASSVSATSVFHFLVIVLIVLVLVIFLDNVILSLLVAHLWDWQRVCIIADNCDQWWMIQVISIIV